jgi:hypothetical protein
MCQLCCCLETLVHKDSLETSMVDPELIHTYLSNRKSKEQKVNFSKLKLTQPFDLFINEFKSKFKFFF